MSPQSFSITLARADLHNASLPLSRRYRALFALKHHACLSPPTSATLPAIEAIASCLSSTPSALLKHELAYCLGQTQNPAAAPPLRQRLLDFNEDAMVRHESAEALGALGDVESLGLLRERWLDEKEEVVVRETAEIAVGRIEWETSQVGGKGERVKKSAFTSVDPAPPLADGEAQASIPELQKTLLDTTLPLFTRYRAMFALRDLASPPTLPTSEPAVLALASGFSDPSALFRHEIAFVFGQLSHPASIPALVAALGDRKEDAMVRHEAAEALGSLGEEDGVIEVLKTFLNDEVDVVRESVVVALDMAEFERSGQADYAVLSGGDTEGGVAPQVAPQVAQAVTA